MSDPTVVKFMLTQEKGYFGLLTDCVWLSKAAMNRGAEPYFFMSNDVHRRRGLSQNYFDYYFEQINLPKAALREAYGGVLRGENRVEIRDRYDINEYWSGDRLEEIANTIVTVREGAFYFTRNIRIKEAITKVCRRFWDANLRGKRVLGVHYRGADKFAMGEADAVPFEQMVETIRLHLSKGYEEVFLATDDRRFFDLLTTSSPGIRVTWYAAPSRETPAWLNRDDNFRKGATAVIDSLLLSNCALLIKTPSLLSAWSKVFRQDLDIVMVGRPHDRPYGETNLTGSGYWPERCLWCPGNGPRG
jgi:hypothetical protein